MKRLILFIIINISVFSKDISVVFKEEGINKFLKGAGSFSDVVEVDLKISKFDLEWRVYDAKIDLIPGGSKFYAKIDIVTENKERKGNAEGEAKFSFDGRTQKLRIDIIDLKVRGLDIFNLVGFYEPKYDLPIKLVRDEKIKINKGKDKEIYLISDLYNESVKVLKGELLIEADIKFIEEK